MLPQQAVSKKLHDVKVVVLVVRKVKVNPDHARVRLQMTVSVEAMSPGGLGQLGQSSVLVLMQVEAFAAKRASTLALLEIFTSSFP